MQELDQDAKDRSAQDRRQPGCARLQPEMGRERDPRAHGPAQADDQQHDRGDPGQRAKFPGSGPLRLPFALP